MHDTDPADKFACVLEKREKAPELLQRFGIDLLLDEGDRVVP